MERTTERTTDKSLSRVRLEGGLREKEFFLRVVESLAVPTLVLSEVSNHAPAAQ